MSPFDPNVTFQQAEQARTQKLSIAKGRRIPDPLGLIEEVSSRHTFHIFNVGPWPQKVNTGSTGWFSISGCPKNKEYVEMAVRIPGIISEFTIKDEFEYNRLMSDGWKFAQEICGIGRNRNPRMALTNYGLFPSKNAVPTEEELYQAKQLLHATCAEIVREARDWFATDRATFSKVVKKERHFAAAEVLNLKNEDWMTKTTPSEAIQCKYCGSVNDPIAVLCSKCSHIIDPVRFKALQDEENVIMGGQEPARRGPGRPPKVQPEV